jgi:glycosyltransferase involved in cell wall biosynthesis
MCSQVAIDGIQIGGHAFDRLNAVVVEPGNAQETAARLLELIDNREMCTAIGRRGKRLSNLLERFATGRRAIRQIADVFV